MHGRLLMGGFSMFIGSGRSLGYFVDMCNGLLVSSKDARASVVVDRPPNEHDK